MKLSSQDREKLRRWVVGGGSSIEPPRRRRDKRMRGMPKLDLNFGRTAFENWNYGLAERPQPVPRQDLVRMYLSTALLRFAQARRARRKVEREALREKAERSAWMAVQIITGRPW